MVVDLQPSLTTFGMTSSEARYFSRFLAKSGLEFHGRVLDIGCGNGRFTRLIAPEAEFIEAIDANENQEWNEPHSNIRFSVGDAERLRFADEVFDTVIAMNMLHHTADPNKAIAEMVRVCRYGGRVVFIEPNRWNPLGYVHLTLLGNHQHFSTGRLLGLLSGHVGGVRLRRFECHCYPVPLPLLRIFEWVEDVLDSSALWKPLAFYNVAVATKSR